jgi:hypothetical protein
MTPARIVAFVWCFAIAVAISQQMGHPTVENFQILIVRMQNAWPQQP